MVMKKNAMRTNLRQSILKSFGRYIAIAAIIMLGAGLFMGLLMTKSDMVATGQIFMDQQNMFDIRFISNYGWSEKFVEEFSQLEGVEDAEGLIYIDMIAQTGENTEDAVYRFYSIPETVNKLALRGGRMPEAENECVMDGFYADDSILGQTVTLSPGNDEDSLESIKHKTFTIVGYVASPLYMDMNRGTTSVGSGSLENCFFISADAFDVDYFTEINVTLTDEYKIYTDEYNDFLEDAVDTLEPAAEKLSEQRFQELKDEIEEDYAEGYQEYLDGMMEYRDGRDEAETELREAWQELRDAEEELETNRRKLIDGGNEIEDGREQLAVAQAELDAYKAELNAKKAAAEPLIAATKAQLDSQYPAAKEGYEQATTLIAQAQANVDQVAAQTGASQLKADIESLKSQISAKQSEQEATEDEEAKAALQGEIETLSTQLWEKNNSLRPYTEAEARLEQTKSQCQPAIDGYNEIIDGYAELEVQEKRLAALEQQLAAAQQEIWDNEIKLNNAYNKLMISWGLWKEGRDEIADGWEEFEEGKLEAKQELEDARAELRDAKEELEEARQEIDDLDAPDLIILDRNSNVGYNNLDSASSIVSGISRVLPIFFLLVASLVCITTMTRMIDEERTQIGTLKALGYSNSEIMSKYLIYSGSSAILGCGLGLVLGCTVFPMIIWEAYKIMLYIRPNIELTVNWPLAITIVVVYTALMLFVTWYSCHKTLEEEPSELIRPKAPDPGKKILLEYLPFWHKISFLNKVTIRNIFRYRQRLAMMLVGIGGCTALLLTGFGLRDSIVNVVDYQFEDVTLYDLSVYFRDEITDQDKDDFGELVADSVEEVMFYHQSSVELDHNARVKEIYMISGDSKLTSFIDLHSGEDRLSMPGEDEVVLSVGVADNMGISVGDRIVLRNADMEELSVTVSGIYDNYVYNYSIISPETIQKQWGEKPEEQMAFVKVLEEKDIHSVAAAITDQDYVMNVSVSNDLADMVRSMMDALDLVVILIVVCAGLLAVIVLYNLTNININERIREIATIKVLGFNASETGAYVFKENIMLTVAGSLLGLGLGRLLLAFVMSQVKIDMVWFKAVAAPASYGWSVVLTLLSAAVVDFIFYFKLDKINMAEALKSVE